MHVNPRRMAAGAAAAVSIALLAGGCSGGSNGSGGGPTKAPVAASTNDINKMPRDQVATGGTLRWPLLQFPDNYNYYELDGTNSATSDIEGISSGSSLLPNPFDFDASGTPSVNHDYFTDVKLTSTDPQVVTYTINPKAKWSDGTPVTWKDFQSLWQATNGTNKAYDVSSTTGYEQISGVKQGTDQYQAVVTYSSPFGDWQSLFSPLMPSSATATPAAFNTGWQSTIPVTAGPFKFQNIDQTAQTLTVVRDPAWWGDPAKLDSIVYRVLDESAIPDALANGEIDFEDIGADADAYARAVSDTNLKIRRAGGPNFRHITFNGTSPVLSDVKVRQAIAMGIDRTTIARALLGPLGGTATPLGNHIFMGNQKGYQDDSGVVAYDTTKAGTLLDQAGWTLSNGMRMKNGKQLTIRFVIPPNSTAQKESQLVQSQLAKIGVKVNIQSVASADFFDKYVTPGDFDITNFAWLGTAFPVSSSLSIYKAPANGQIQQNYSRIGSPELDTALDKAAADLDPAQKIVDANSADKLIWQEVHSLTLYQRPDLKAANPKLANYGALGFATTKYQDIGFTK